MRPFLYTNKRACQFNTPGKQTDNSVSAELSNLIKRILLAKGGMVQEKLVN